MVAVKLSKLRARAMATVKANLIVNPMTMT